MTIKEVRKNRIEYYLSRIIELQKRQEKSNIHNYTKTIKDYKLAIEKELEELVKE